MKIKTSHLVCSFRCFVSVMVAMTIFDENMQASPAEFPEGLNIANGISFFPWQNGVQTPLNDWNLSMETIGGGVLLLSGVPESAPWSMDGGVMIGGKPIKFYLGAAYSATEWDQGRFEVFRGADYDVDGALPVFGIDSVANSATFNGLNVSIANGTLNVGGSQALTALNAQPILASQGFLQPSSLDSALSSATPPHSPAWTAAFVPQGNVSPLPGLSEGGLLSLGTSVASGEKSVAFGTTSTASALSATAIGTMATASGVFSTAVGQNANASGQWSLAVGNGVTASGNYSIAAGLTNVASGNYAIAFGNNSSASGNWAMARGNSAGATGYASTAFGWGTSAKARCETAFGNYNLESNALSSFSVNGLNGLFRVGNGISSTSRSDAISILWCGQTTLTNKDWKTNVTSNPSNASAPLEDPASTTDSGGNALVVDGHTVFNGKVLMSVPQGDISMGAYAN